MGVFWPRTPLFPILGILTPVQGRRVRKGREPPLTLRKEKQYCILATSSPVIWACATGWRLALYLCSPSPALGLRVVAYLLIFCLHCTPSGPEETDWCRGAKIAARQFLFLTCPAITLTAGLILKEDKKPSFVGERQFGRHFRRQFGRG